MRASRRLILLAAGLAAATVAGPAHAATTTIGSDLSQPATVAISDPNDILFWSADGPAGVEVTQQGEARAIRIKGGTVQSDAQTAHAEASDPNYDIMHWVVLRPQGDGTWRAVGASENVVAPVIGRNGVTADTITEIRQPEDKYRVCVKPGDRISLASVGGYVPTVDGPGQPTPGFQDGLPYQVFGRAPGKTTQEFRAGGLVSPDTVVSGTPRSDLELLMQAVIGTGPDARWTCQTPAEREAAGIAAAKAKPKAPLRPMATPLARSRKLTGRGAVAIHLTCRAAGTACGGTIELRAHKQRIGLGRYLLGVGASGAFTVRLTPLGRHYVTAAMASRRAGGKLRTAVVVTAAGGRTAGATITLRK